MKPLILLWNVLSRSSNDESVLTEPLAYRGWKWLWQRIPSRPVSDTVFDRLEAMSWDVLLVLDACRADVLSTVAKTAVVGSVRSPVSSTPEFLDEARRHRLFEGTIYVSANPQTGDRSPGSDLTLIRSYEDGWDDTLETVPAPHVLAEIRDRLGEGRPIVGHLMQPHYPHICEIDGRTMPVPNGLHPQAFDRSWLADQNVQAVLATGAFDLSDARRSYEACVDYAWSHVSSFAAELASEGYRVVITADHGELFGERGFVEHPVGVQIGPLVRVPWVVFEPVSATDRQPNVAEQLEALGYRE